MPRKMTMGVGGDDFRPTQVDDDTLVEPPSSLPGARRSTLRPTGRVRHDEKITVYVSSAELLALEQARLRLRASFGVAVDRGRIVREAVASMIEDFEARGATSDLVQRLSQR